MASRHQPRRSSRKEPKAGGYLVIVRGPDGRTRLERVESAAAYKARLLALKRSKADSVSIDEIAGLLDA